MEDFLELIIGIIVLVVVFGRQSSKAKKKRQQREAQQHSAAREAFADARQAYADVKAAFESPEFDPDRLEGQGVDPEELEAKMAAQARAEAVQARAGAVQARARVAQARAARDVRAAKNPAPAAAAQPKMGMQQFGDLLTELGIEVPIVPKSELRRDADGTPHPHDGDSHEGYGCSDEGRSENTVFETQRLDGESRRAVPPRRAAPDARPRPVTGARRPSAARPAEAPTASSAAGGRGRQLIGNASDMRRAIVAAELLAKPVALRRPGTRI